MRILFVAVVVAFLAACTPQSEEAPPVIVPKGPGEQAETMAPGDVGTDRWVAPGEADLKYVASMIVHHRQALEMSALAPERARNETVKGLASRIHDTQGPEIGAMEQWRRQFAENAPAHGHNGSLPEVDHGSMPGMATDEQLAALKAASGTDFDRLFLRLMIAHHEGALTMAVDLLSSGSDVRVEEMANDVVASQSDEIARMKAISLP
ncbi:DUF305 domain-containing protein [Actinosynnema sp. NPDC047251]|uniref:DUF305 domain-containing protein n=1 Tax=Saccharothrix espanaensis (strain ATCC 51144 / DSM 44229 / JCM 9112 / NBRC 15066 / NRRL 15764) TaxID=1179773 RepID=K0K058_SACES|nr:DUF305 domain-containing protein [Saccharothrix espanaensis]CCH30294.1 hypothetical protein BN6_29870 [Saccharothrix espanaensis DSM 44229]